MPQFIKLADEYPQFQSQDTDWTWTYAHSHIANLCTHITPLYTHSIVFIHINCTLSHWNAVSRLKNSFTNTFSLHRIHCPISTHTHTLAAVVWVRLFWHFSCALVCANKILNFQLDNELDPTRFRFVSSRASHSLPSFTTLHCTALHWLLWLYGESHHIDWLLLLLLYPLLCCCEQHTFTRISFAQACSDRPLPPFFSVSQYSVPFRQRNA